MIDMYTGYQEILLYKSAAVVIGSFRCAPWYRHFEEAGPIDQGNTIVFPRTSVIISQEGYRPFLTDPNQVVFYNLRQPYRRRVASERGDHCEYFAFNPGLVISALVPYDPAANDRPDSPFDFSHSPTDAATYLLQRRLVESLRAHPDTNPLYVEETSLEILDRTIASAYRAKALGRRQMAAYLRTRRLHQDLIQQTLAILNARFSEPLSLQNLAAELYVSPYHLCRIFRKETGSTIHHYLEQIRLRVALDDVLPGGRDLSGVALDLGFSSHSHFTHAMRKAFGQPPSALRASLTTPVSTTLIPKI